VGSGGVGQWWSWGGRLARCQSLTHVERGTEMKLTRLTTARAISPGTHRLRAHRLVVCHWNRYRSASQCAALTSSTKETQAMTRLAPNGCVARSAPDFERCLWLRTFDRYCRYFGDVTWREVHVDAWCHVTFKPFYFLFPH